MKKIKKTDMPIIYDNVKVGERLININDFAVLRCSENKHNCLFVIDTISATTHFFYSNKTKLRAKSFAAQQFIKFDKKDIEQLKSLYTSDKIINDRFYMLNEVLNLKL